MRSPFPGMDPYLERYWGDVGGSLAVTAKVTLNRQLAGDLVARNDRRLIPDPASPGSDPVRQPFVQILDTADGNRVVTVVEFLSPSNKTDTAARASYRAKQGECLEARTSLVEVDLTRAGHRRLLMDMNSIPAERRGEYMVSVWRAYTGFGRREGYGLPLRERLPGVRVPLRNGDPDIVLDLQSLVDQAYEAGAYGRALDYGRPLDEPLAADDAAWADGAAAGGGATDLTGRQPRWPTHPIPRCCRRRPCSRSSSSGSAGVPSRSSTATGSSR